MSGCLVHQLIDALIEQSLLEETGLCKIENVYKFSFLSFIYVDNAHNSTSLHYTATQMHQNELRFSFRIYCKNILLKQICGRIPRLIALSWIFFFLDSLLIVVC